MRKNLIVFLFFVSLSLLLIFGEKAGLLGSLRTILQKPVFILQGKILNLHPVPLTDKNLLAPFVDANRLSVCLEENERFSKMLGAPLPPAWKFLPAHIVGQGDLLLIDQGGKDGLKKGMTVVWENILVGMLDKTGDHFARIRTPLTSETKIPVLVKSASGFNVQAKGILTSQSDSLILDKVLTSENLVKGDLVVTAGGETGDLVGWLPDLVVGSIGEVIIEPGQVYKRAKVAPLIKYTDLRMVFVVLR